jgi:hypothetical protein
MVSVIGWTWSRVCWTTLVGIGFVLVSLPAYPQATPSFQPAGGPLSESVPAVFDTDGTPGPSDGDAKAWPRWSKGMVGSEAVVITPCGDGMIATDTSGNPPAPGKLDLFSSMGTDVMVDSFNDQMEPVGASGDDGNSMGSMMVGDGDGDGIYDMVMVQSTKPAINGMFSIQQADTDGDGSPDYISLGSLLGVIEDCGKISATRALWIPITRTRGPFKSVVLDLDNDKMGDRQFLVGPPVAFVAGVIPTVSGWGLLALILGTAAISVRKLRIRD